MEISTFVNITVNTEMVIITKTTTKQQYLYFVLFFENAHAGGGEGMMLSSQWMELIHVPVYGCK